jgi:DNA-binding beta-propeller fold protein YncE
MKNNGIIFFLIILSLIIAGIVVIDFNSSKPGEQAANPYAYDIDPFSKTDTALIMFSESRNFSLDMNEPSGVAIFDGKIFIVGDRKLQIIDTSGTLLKEESFDQKPSCVYASSKNIFIGFTRSVSVLNLDGQKTGEWTSFPDSTVITSLSEHSGTVFVADAGKRMVRKFNMDGKPLGTIEGKSGNDQIHGFIIPSPYFDLAFNPEGELWIVNPGKHSLENYTIEGELRTWWQASSIKIEGFSGCCNPAHFAFLPDGSFVTSEKGMVRIKTYKPSGEFSGVVAAPFKFNENSRAPDLAVDKQGNVYALDLDKKMLRVFVKKLK